MKSNNLVETLSKRKKVGFASLGCPKNLVDSEIMIGRLSISGFEITNSPEEAEILVVNTCGFIDSAKEESINTILEMARYKEIGQCERLVVAGCLAHRYKDKLMNSIPEIDAVIGLDELDRIEEACSTSFTPTKGSYDMSRRIYGVADARVRTSASHSRYLKVSEGCDHKCSFCVIPTFRGLHRSRTSEDIVAEAKVLADEGAIELNLVAQDLGAYGKDLDSESDFPGLLKKIADIDTVRWIRLHYIYPQGLNLALQEEIANNPKCVPYLDIPFQHGSAKVLKDMRRPGNNISSLKKLEELRRNIAGLAIRTSIIVGYPTEEEQDFEQLIEFIKAAQFDHLGVFCYSHEENSEAAERFTDTISAEEKANRRSEIMALQQDISLEKHETMVGNTYECLVEGLHAESDMLLSGRLPVQAPEVDGSVIITDGFSEGGEIVKVEITEAHPYDLVGRIINGAEK